MMYARNYNRFQVSGFRLLVAGFWLLTVLVGCKSRQEISDDALILKKVRVITVRNADGSQQDKDRKFDAKSYEAYVRQKPVGKLFSFIPRPWARKVVVDSMLTHFSCEDIRMQMENNGYLRAQVSASILSSGTPKPGKHRKVEIQYVMTPGRSYYISDFSMSVKDTSLMRIIDNNREVLHEVRKGSQFSVNNLAQLRKKITQLFTERGYFLFNKDYITFDVDTLPGREDVSVRMNIGLYKSAADTIETPHPVFHVHMINYLNGNAGKKLNLREKTLKRNTMLEEGGLYSSRLLHKTYNNFARLEAVKYTNINFRSLPDTTLLDCDIQLSTNKSQTVSIMPEGTNTAGDFGAAASVTYENRNLFHGSEVFSLQGKAAFEAISGLEGYSDKFFQEYLVEAKLTFPQLIVPFLSGRIARKSSASTEFSLRYDMQNRPEFHRRVWAATWRYKWQEREGQDQFRLDVLDINYVYMPWISDTFRQDYLDDNTSRNAILRYNYEDLFIMKTGVGYTLSKKMYALRLNLETAGNFLSLLSYTTKFPKDDGHYKVFNIAFAQYVKADVDFCRHWQFDDRNQLAFHVGLGVAYPYGNSQILPFEKRYFSGGANSVRGWSVRSLGPGRFRGTDGRIDFINQTGDMKLDLNLEHRTKLFWKFSGAVFIDAGNIWTIRDYKDQPGGQFRIQTFWKELAASYGIGLRLNLGYFILRLDAGMKAVNPDYDTQRDHFPIYHPSIKRDGALHFAVGLPF